MSELKLGAYLIVRDAEGTIENLLRSLVVPKEHNGGFIKLAVDELVIVDTGSTDNTIHLIEKFFGQQFPISLDSSIDWASKETDEQGIFFERVVLARMQWPNDFAAARNLAFSLGRAKWRMWLDADDIFPRAENLLPTICELEIRQPTVNAIFLPYDYCPPDVMQDKCRVVRWADGWKWEGVIHEDLVRTSGGRSISYVKDLVVEHRPTDPEHGQKSLERNERMLRLERARAQDRHDARNAGIMSYYLGMYARNVGTPEAMVSARADLNYAADVLGPTNLACYSMVELCRGELKLGDEQAALNAASRAVAIAPEIADGWGALGVALVATKQYSRAAIVFDRLKKLPKPGLEATRDRVWNDGIVWANAAVAYVHETRLDAAEDSLKRVPEVIALNDLVWMTYSRAASDLQKLSGLRALEHFAAYLVANNEPVKAVKVLTEYAPSNVEGLPAVSNLRRQITDKMQQLNSWADYKRVYAAECNEVFDRDQTGVDIIRKQGRAIQALRWAERLPKEGDPVNVYVIGIHGGWIEEDVMRANDRIHITACDVNPNANSAIARLTKLFPDRVTSHVVKAHHYDWIPKGKEGTFDAVFCFEVIEHVPDDHEMVKVINRLLHVAGTLLLSTPIGEYWVAPDATKRHHWHQHVRAYQPDQLWDLLRTYGFRGDLYATDNRVLHFADMVKVHNYYATADVGIDRTPKVTIWCASAPSPFDPLSPREGHCGGSEEAVIHLSHALAQQLGTPTGDVTVYAPVPDREFKPHVNKNVLWRALEEFDPERLSGVVLVWRNPRAAAWLKAQNPKLRVLNWLHDTSYGVHPEEYAAVDGTITLSKFHQRAIDENDGFGGPFLEGMNGIDPSEFIGLDLTKREHSVIYASAPNRGLDLLLDIWPKVRAAVPDATLDIYYGWETTEKMMRSNPSLRLQLEPLLTRLRQDIADLGPQGVTYHGGVPHDELHAAFARSKVWAAPEYNFEETFCISALKAQATRCIPVIWRSGALPEVCNTNYIAEDRAKYEWNLIDALKHGELHSTSNEWALEHSWAHAAVRFGEFITAKRTEIAIFASFGRKFSDNSLHAANGVQLGGSEETIILLSNALARRGVTVTVFADLPEGERTHRSADGALWMPFEMARPCNGINLIWRNVGLAAGLALRWKVSPVVLWLMDPEYDRTAMLEADAECSATVVLSREHERLLGLKNTLRIPNGLDLTELPPLSAQNDKGRHPEWVMWATSPDRGLHSMLERWPEIVALYNDGCLHEGKTEIPQPQLHIFYGTDAWRQMAEARGDTAALERIEALHELMESLAPLGVVYHGSATRSELLAWHVRCGTWAYPHVGFDETQCISAIKAVACGMTVVTWEKGVIPEMLADGGIIAVGQHRAALYNAVLADIMIHPISINDRIETAMRTRARYDVNKIAQDWNRLAERLTQAHGLKTIPTASHPNTSFLHDNLPTISRLSEPVTRPEQK